MFRDYVLTHTVMVMEGFCTRTGRYFITSVLCQNEVIT